MTKSRKQTNRRTCSFRGLFEALENRVLLDAHGFRAIGDLSAGLLYPEGIEPGNPAECESIHGKCYWVDAQATYEDPLFKGDGSYQKPFTSFEVVVGNLDGTIYNTGLLRGGDVLYVTGTFTPDGHHPTANNLQIQLARGIQGGTPENPTTIKSYRGQPRAVFDLNYQLQFAVEVIGQTGIPIDGIRIQNILVRESTSSGIVIKENVTWADINSVEVTANEAPGDGTSGPVVFTQDTNVVYDHTLRNSYIHDNIVNPTGSENNRGGVAVVNKEEAMPGSKAHIHNNLFHGEWYAVREKHNGPNVTVEVDHNIVYDSFGLVYMRAGANDIHHNIAWNVDRVFVLSLENEKGPMHNEIYNNTVVDWKQILDTDASGAPTVLAHQLDFHDNIFSGQTSALAVFELDDQNSAFTTFQAAMLNLDHNLFDGINNLDNFFQLEDGQLYSLDQTESLLEDLSNFVADPEFVDADARNFQLHPTSPARRAGRNGNTIGALNALESPVRFGLGPVDNGIAANDNATGTGFILFSHQDVHSRFDMRQDNSDHLIAVQFRDGQWQFSNNSQWIPFVPVSSDRLIASVDYGADSISGLQALTGTVNGIEQGYLGGDLSFTPNRWANRFNAGEFTVEGNYFVVSGPVKFDLGSVDQGIAANDNATGTGYILFSHQDVHTRFGMRQDNSDHVIAVQYRSGQWYASDNVRWLPFTPVSADRLIASVNYDADVIHSLHGFTGVLNGIQRGFSSSDLTFFANRWAGTTNRGEFTVEGSYFKVGGPPKYELGSIDHGIAANDNATGTGYILFSQQDVHARFGMRQDNSDHLIAVQYQTDRWFVSNNRQWIPFTPATTDRLIASVDYEADTICGLQGNTGVVHSIPQGYRNGDLTFHANRWNGVYNKGEFTVTGTHFEISIMGSRTDGIASDGNAVDDNSDPSLILRSERNAPAQFHPTDNENHQLISVRLVDDQSQRNHFITVKSARQPAGLGDEFVEVLEDELYSPFLPATRICKDRISRNGDSLLATHGCDQEKPRNQHQADGSWLWDEFAAVDRTHPCSAQLSLKDN